MPSATILEGILYFTAYSVLGWICESIWCSIGTKKPTNRGFLAGPWCPIYGFGALLILLLTAPVAYNPLLVFLIALVTATILEYFTGWLLETLFQTKWWDYSCRKLQIKGRICLQNAILFGLMGLFLTCFIHPFAKQVTALIPAATQTVLCALLLLLFAADLIRSIAAAGKLQEKLHEFKSILEELKQYQEATLWFDKNDFSGSIETLKALYAEKQPNEKLEEILSRITKLKEHKGGSFRITKAFPHMRSKYFGKELESLKQTWNEKHKKNKS